MDLLLRLNRWPPRKCRLVARKQGRPMSNRQIAQRGGLNPSTVDQVSKLKTWEKVQVGTLIKYCLGCGIDPLKPRWHAAFLRVISGKFFKAASPAQRRMYARILGQP